jgi:hypothetical protein
MCGSLSRRVSSMTSVSGSPLEAAIALLTTGENPKPFIWTKSADEILQRLAAYLDRIPGAGH